MDPVEILRGQQLSNFEKKLREITDYKLNIYIRNKKVPLPKNHPSSPNYAKKGGKCALFWQISTFFV